MSETVANVIMVAALLISLAVIVWAIFDVTR